MKRKNIRRIPDGILQKVKSINDRFIIVGSMILVKHIDIEEGKFNHLMLRIKNGKLDFPESFTPDENRGKYSNKNAIGYEIKRKDLPLITKYNTIEAPNFGDYSKGTHDIDLPYKAYIKEFIAPKNNSFKVYCDVVKISEKYPIVFEVDEILDTKSKTFSTDLLFNLNLLQENVGSIDVQSSKRSYGDYLQSIQLDWEILPPGNMEIILRRILGKTVVTSVQIELIEKRIDFFRSLNPIAIINGTSGMQRYLGAKIEENLIIFENLRYGNAMYLMYEDWESLSKKSRIELLSGRFGNNFDRVLHIEGWENKVRELIDKKRSGLNIAI